ncbi:hypothetical protein LX36DRAFT_492139 [Colletotrichum falcatum]|nr:hypothetical protein LX36DRAFT_492139 [Colletotrichum falcatum]
MRVLSREPLEPCIYASWCSSVLPRSQSLIPAERPTPSCLSVWLPAACIHVRSGCVLKGGQSCLIFFVYLTPPGCCTKIAPQNLAAWISTLFCSAVTMVYPPRYGTLSFQTKEVRGFIHREPVSMQPFCRFLLRSSIPLPI